VQTTLLSIAIALILALLAALVGPHFVDWNKYRRSFETHAGQITGLNVRINGPIDARLLPTPSVTLRRIDVTRPGQAGALQARRLDVEFALGSLVRGEWKANEVRIDGAELALGIDRDGKLEWPAPSGGFDPNTISIESLDIRDSRVLLADAASGSGVVLDKFEFKGELRTLAGPLKGQGSFYLDGQHYPYRVAASRTAENTAVRVRLTVDPIDLPLTVEADAQIAIEDGIPRLDGSLQFARPVGAPQGPRKDIVEPWRIGGRIKADSKAATVEQLEFQYGPDARPIRLRGNARITFGQASLLSVVLSSPQVDLDRVLGLPETERKRPGAAIRALADQFAGKLRLPIPVELGISVESLTLAGATLQRVAGDLKSMPEGWHLEMLEFRAPGLTSAQFTGRLGVAGERLSFAGRTRIESKDPRALTAWLADQTDARGISASSMSLDGDIRLGRDAIAAERFSAEIDRMKIEGRLAYYWAANGRPPRVEASLRAPDIDIDRTYGLMQGLLAGTGTVFDRPREGEVTAQIGRAVFAGIEARRADVNMRFNTHGIEIERLTIGDFGGATLVAKGRIDTRAQSPAGALTLDLHAKGFDGIVAFLEKLSPPAAQELRRNAKRFAPAKLRASLSLAPPSQVDDPQATGAFKLEGIAGTYEIAMQGDFGAGRDDFSFENFERLKAAKVNLGGRIEAGNGGALIALLGLERLVSVARGRGRLDIEAKGPLDGDMVLTGELLAGGLDVAARGNIRFAGSQGPTAGLDIKVASASLLVPRLPGREPDTLPLAMTTRLALAEGVVRLTDLNGKIANTDVGGRLRIGFGQPLSLRGDLTFGAINMPIALASAIGVPQGARGAWSAEPFEGGLIGNLEGEVVLRSTVVTLPSALRARDVRALLRFEPERLSLEDIDGTFGDGRVAGGFVFQRDDDGITANSRLRFAGTEIGALPEGSPLSGRVTMDLDVEGTGRSPAALINALKGSGTFTLQDGKVAGLDPAAFEAVVRAVDQGLPIDAMRVGERLEAAFRNGTLAIALAQGELSLASGRLRVSNAAVRAKGADLALNASIDLAEGNIDARLTLTGLAHEDVLKGARPEIRIALRGPIGSPKRTLDVTPFSNWLAMRAIEQKSKRIDELESGKDIPVAPNAPSAPVPQSAPPPVITPAPAPRAATPSSPPGEPVAKTPPAHSKKEPATQAAKRLPPPVDLRPGDSKQTQPSPKPAAKRAPSWLENLLGP
jgi:large subunit ribosomal protein L24